MKKVLPFIVPLLFIAALTFFGCGGSGDGGVSAPQTQISDQYVIDANETVEADGDLFIVSDGDAVIDGDIVALTHGGQSITVQAEGDINVSGNIIAGHGSTAHIDGGTVTLISRFGDIHIHSKAAIVAGNGKDGAHFSVSAMYRGETGPVYHGGQGGSVILSAENGTVTLPETAGVVTIGNGGFGTSVASSDTSLDYSDLNLSGGDSGILDINATEILGLYYTKYILEEEIRDEQNESIIVRTAGTLLYEMAASVPGQVAGGIGGNGGSIVITADETVAYFGNADARESHPVLQVRGGDGGNGFLRGGDGEDANATGQSGIAAGGDGQSVICQGGDAGAWMACTPHEASRGGKALARGGSGRDGAAPHGTGGNGGNATAISGKLGLACIGRKENGEWIWGPRGAEGPAWAYGGYAGRGGDGCQDAIYPQGGSGGTGGEALAQSRLVIRHDDGFGSLLGDFSIVTEGLGDVYAYGGNGGDGGMGSMLSGTPGSGGTARAKTWSEVHVAKDGKDGSKRGVCPGASSASSDQEHSSASSSSVAYYEYRIEPYSATIYLDDTVAFTASLFCCNVSTEVVATWKSLNEPVATIDADGLARCHKVGTAAIRSEYLSYFGDAEVECIAKEEDGTSSSATSIASVSSADSSAMTSNGSASSIISSASSLSSESLHSSSVFAVSSSSPLSVSSISSLVSSAAVSSPCCLSSSAAASSGSAIPSSKSSSSRLSSAASSSAVSSSKAPVSSIKSSSSKAPGSVSSSPSSASSAAVSSTKSSAASSVSTILRIKEQPISLQITTFGMIYVRYNLYDPDAEVFISQEYITDTCTFEADPGGIVSLNKAGDFLEVTGVQNGQTQITSTCPIDTQPLDYVHSTTTVTVNAPTVSSAADSSIAVSSVSSEQSSVASGSGLNWVGYYNDHKVQVHWAEAETICTQNGGHLPSISQLERGVADYQAHTHFGAAAFWSDESTTDEYGTVWVKYYYFGSQNPVGEAYGDERGNAFVECIR